MAPATGTTNTVHSIHRFAVIGSSTSSVALATAAIDSDHPMNALTGYQIAGVDVVAPVLNPYRLFGGTRRRISGTLMITSSTHDATSRARVRSGSRPAACCVALSA